MPSYLTRNRIILIGIVTAMLGVVAISLTTNLERMHRHWDEVGRTGQTQAAALKLEPLEISAGGTRHAFQVEVMRTDADRARGLMFRPSMPQNQGMLFDFERDQMVSMWMKNTYLPLDMVFILSNGRIHRIESRTEPQSERVISSGAPVRAVLELNANIANKLGLRAGDRVDHPIFR